MTYIPHRPISQDEALATSSTGERSTKARTSPRTISISGTCCASVRTPRSRLIGEMPFVFEPNRVPPMGPTGLVDPAKGPPSP